MGIVVLLGCVYRQYHMSRGIIRSAALDLTAPRRSTGDNSVYWLIVSFGDLIQIDYIAVLKP